MIQSFKFGLAIRRRIFIIAEKLKIISLLPFHLSIHRSIEAPQIFTQRERNIVEIEIVGPNCDTLHQISYLCSTKCKMIMRSILIIFFLPFLSFYIYNAIFIVSNRAFTPFFYFYLFLFPCPNTFSGEYTIYLHIVMKSNWKTEIPSNRFTFWRRNWTKKKYSNKFNRVWARRRQKKIKCLMLQDINQIFLFTPFHCAHLFYFLFFHAILILIFFLRKNQNREMKEKEEIRKFFPHDFIFLLYCTFTLCNFFLLR